MAQTMLFFTGKRCIPRIWRRQLTLGRSATRVSERHIYQYQKTRLCFEFPLFRPEPVLVK